MPARVREDAASFFQFLQDPLREIGLHDEREYFLGELALITGTASRVLFRIDEAKAWFQRAEANFALVQNANAHWARIAYQRMALAAEERRFDEVLGVADLWANTFRRLEMPEDALKCRFLEGAVHWELGDTAKAISINREICLEAERGRHDRLLAQASGNLVLYYGAIGDTQEALRNASKSLAVLQRLGDRITTVKLKWSMAALMRKQGQKGSALEALREAQADARELGMRGDLAALHLVIADLLLESGHEAQAEWEIRAALPIIDEEKMVPEGIAALSLLRESLRHRQIDKQALRELHGYFQEQ